MAEEYDKIGTGIVEQNDALKTERPTVIGEIPPKLRAVLTPHLGSGAPEFFRLPKPNERDPFTGASRSWLLDFDASLMPAKKFIVRVRLRGKRRGVCFVDLAKYLSALRSQTKGDQHE